MNFHNVFKYFSNSNLDAHIMEQVSNIEIGKDVTPVPSNPNLSSMIADFSSRSRAQLLPKNNDYISQNHPQTRKNLLLSTSTNASFTRNTSNHSLKQPPTSQPMGPGMGLEQLPSNNNNSFSFYNTSTSMPLGSHKVANDFSFSSNQHLNHDSAPLLDDSEKKYLKDFLESIKSESLFISHNSPSQPVEPFNSLNTIDSSHSILTQPTNLKQPSQNYSYNPNNISQNQFDFSFGGSSQIQQLSDFVPFTQSNDFPIFSKNSADNLPFSGNSYDSNLSNNLSVLNSTVVKNQIHNDIAQNTVLNNGPIPPLAAEASQSFHSDPYISNPNYDLSLISNNRRYSYINSQEFLKSRYNQRGSNIIGSKKQKLNFATPADYNSHQSTTKSLKSSTPYSDSTLNNSYLPFFNNSNIISTRSSNDISINSTNQNTLTNQNICLKNDDIIYSNPPFKASTHLIPNKKTKNGKESNGFMIESTSSNCNTTTFSDYTNDNANYDNPIELFSAVGKADSKSPLESPMTAKNEPDEQTEKSRKQLDEESKRLNHVESERKRRQLIKSYFTKLTDIINSNYDNEALQNANFIDNTTSPSINSPNQSDSVGSDNKFLKNEKLPHKLKKKNTLIKMSKSMVIEKAYDYILALKLENDQLRNLILEKSKRK
ncbi:hypothetical protein BB561_002989 [Smittium simulii]|uniref:BHLH domain-containing protein n=1 Tax=Smittium simulii TaxID=133385 RepID=A0A2T9YND8_9FUNG|nr:hypothetical protein BB561_002989 [Smittium simulii]